MRNNILNLNLGTASKLFASALNFGSILDRTMDQIEDAPEFAALPPGIHTVKIIEIKQTAQKRKDGEVPTLRFKYELIETVEMADAAKTPPTAGSISTENFGLDEQGLPYLKKHVKDAWDKMPQSSLGEVIQSLEGATVHVTSQLNQFESKKQPGVMIDGWRSAAMILA